MPFTPGPGDNPALSSNVDAVQDWLLGLARDAQSRLTASELSVFDEPEFLALRELVQSADAGFVNLEILFHNWEPDVIPAASSGGTYMQADPSIAEELVWMGFDMVSMANNHTGDYGYGGLRRTTEAVEIGRASCRERV